MQEQFDVIVIGSGPAGTHAAVPLVEAGRSVCILDGGQVGNSTQNETPTSFDEVRTTDPAQWEIFLGKDLSAIPVGSLERGFGGGMLSGNRGYATRGVATHLPVHVENGMVAQSLAKGGFGAVWGAASAFLNARDMEEMGLPAEQMKQHYLSIAKRIGISGPSSEYPVQPPLQPDHHAEAMIKRARTKASALQRMHVRVTQPHSAVLTQDMGSRKATALTDMDFYTDAGKSIYRPQYTLETLLEKPNLRYIGGVIVRLIEETPEGVVVFGYSMDDPNTVLRWSARKVIVAAGAVNTARILLCSFNLYNTPLPFVMKPHVYTACLHPKMLGKSGPAERSSLCQLLVIDEDTTHGFEAGCAQIYSYRSLLLFRLLDSMPCIPVPQALALLSMFSPALLVADTRFPAFISDGHSLALTKDNAAGSLKIVYQQEMNDARRASLKKLHRALRMTGLLPLKSKLLPAGSTFHSGGTVPVAARGAHPLTCSQDGKVHGRNNIYVADASMFRSLPALPYTLTIMANAERVGEIVSEAL